MAKLTRRQAILGATSATACALAGCLVSDDETDNATDDGGDSTDDETDAALADTSLVHWSSDCADGDGGAVVVHDGTSYLIDGLAMAPDPCHEPALRDAAFEDGDLMISVETTQRDLGKPTQRKSAETEPCPDCAGAVSYDLQAELTAADAVERVLVSHGDEEYEITSEEFSTDPYPSGTEIETAEAECGNTGVDEAEISLEDGTLTVNGRRSVGNPCHDAVVEDVSVVDNELTLTIRFLAYEHDGGDEVGGCNSCISEIAYEASVDLLNEEAIEDIVIDHADGERHTF